MSVKTELVEVVTLPRNLVAALHPQTTTILGNSTTLTGPQLQRNHSFRQAFMEGSTLPVPYASAITPTRLLTVTRQHYGTKVSPLSLSEQTKLSQCAMDNQSAQTGNESPAAPAPTMITVTYAQLRFVKPWSSILPSSRESLEPSPHITTIYGRTSLTRPDSSANILTSHKAFELDSF